VDENEEEGKVEDLVWVLQKLRRTEQMSASSAARLTSAIVRRVKTLSAQISLIGALVNYVDSETYVVRAPVLTE
jgi:hypothetical protein